MRGRTLDLEVVDKRGKAAKTIPLYQYDYGQKLIIKGVELPEYYEVHFSNQQHGEAVTVLGDSTGVLIPDSLVATGESIYVWLYLHDTSYDGETEYMGVIPVIKRAQPTDVTPTPEEQSIITEVIAALNNMQDDMSDQVNEAKVAKEAAEDAQAGAEAAESAVEGYASAAATAKEAAETAQTAAETAQAAAESASAAATTAYNNADSARASAVSAKEYAETAATNASDSATSASNFATSASNSASATEGYKTAAETAQGKAEDAQEAAETAQAAAEAAEDGVEADALIAEGYAVGKQNGEDVASGSTYYHNNAKYYADAASDSATAAAGSEDNAEDSAEDAEAYAVGTRGGVDVSSDDPAYENNAKYYAEEAATVLADKLDAPATAGTSGQVLTSDGEGGQAWADPSGAIDDTAGEGDTDVTWSANKLTDEFGDVLNAIQGKQDAPEAAGTAGQVLGLDNNLKPVWKTASGGSVVDGELDKNSTNPVENSVIAEKFEDYDDVLLMRTNQLLDYKTCTQHNATLSSAAGMSTSTHGKVAIIPVSVDANTTITVHRTIVGKRFSIGLSTSENPAIGESIRAYTEGNNNAELSLTATSSDKTLLIYYYLDTQDTTYTAEQLLSAIMVNYGAYIGYEPYLADAFISKKESEYSLVLGEEMFPSSAPTWEGDGWQENTSKQYTHISGGDYQPLKISIPQIKADTPYLLEFDIESNTSTGSPDDSNAVYPSLRGSTPFSIYYGYTGNVHYSFTIFTGTSGSLATTTLDFQPCSATVPSIRGRSFDGTIKNISLKEAIILIFEIS